MAAHIVLFDLGNVIVDWQPIRLYERLFDRHEDAQSFCETVCTLEWHVAHDRGVPMVENAAPLIARYPQFQAEITAWRTRWLDMFAGYIAGMPPLVARLEEARVSLYGLSNIPAEKAEETFSAFPLIRILRDVVVSGAEKVVKPDPRIYEIAWQRMDCPPRDSVFFIDDSVRNVEAARAFGFRAHHFTGASALEAALQVEGLL